VVAVAVVAVGITPVAGPVGFVARVAALSDHGFAVAWSRTQLGVQTLYLRSFSSAGTPLAPETVVATGNGDSIGVFLKGLAASANGRLALLWNEEDDIHCGEDAPCERLLLRLFDPDGTSRGAVLEVGTAASAPFDRALCGDLTAAGTTWVVTWLGWHLDVFLNEYAIFVRRFGDATPDTGVVPVPRRLPSSVRLGSMATPSAAGSWQGGSGRSAACSPEGR
jgi:hypothetical protein